jgi:hypothetical protein
MICILIWYLLGLMPFFYWKEASDGWDIIMVKAFICCSGGPGMLFIIILDRVLFKQQSQPESLKIERNYVEPDKQEHAILKLGRRLF